MPLVIMLIGLSLLSSGINDSYSDTGFSQTKSKPGIVMKFCYNAAFTMQDCKEQYEGYTWTDRINVLVYAPGWNTDPGKVDSIGTSANPINVYTDTARVDDIDFSETDSDTGLFMGVVKLTGQMGYVVHENSKTTITPPGMTMEGRFSSFDRAVMIATSPQDGRVTVSWEANEDTVITQTASYTWRSGEVWFEKDVWELGETVKFYVRDADLWTHHAGINTYYVEVWSDSDSQGFLAPVLFVKKHDVMNMGSGEGDKMMDMTPKHPSFMEASKNPLWEGYEHTHFIDLLPGEFIMTTDDFSYEGRLRVSPGDNIYIKYVDITLPNPYSSNDELDIISTAKVAGGSYDSTRAEILELNITDSTKEIISESNSKQTVQIISTFENKNDNYQPYSWIIQIKNSEGIVQHIDWFPGQLQPLDFMTMSHQWIPKSKDSYTVETFVWSNLIDIAPITNPKIISHIVT